MVALYYRSYGGTTWQDISQYIGNKGVISWSQELGVNLLEFKFSLEKPLDEDLDPLIIEVGDDFIFCNDNTRSNVVGNCAGVVINNGKKIISWDLKNDRPYLRYDITVRQRDFSKDITSFDYKTDTNLSTIIDDILNTHTNDLIGGYLAVSSETIPKYELIAPDLTISSFDFQGKALKALKQLLDGIGYYFRIQYFIEQNSTTTLNLVGKIIIFNASGTPSTEVWAEGLNNNTVRRGYIINPSFIDEDTTPDQPSILWGETLPSIETDFESAKNYFNFIALIQDGLNLTREDFTQTNLENFKLANKAKDILYVARLITDYVVSVSNTTTFTLPTGTIQKLLYDQQRLTDNNLGGQMVCKITSNGVEYIRVFTISGVTVTLASGITGLKANDTFELINSYDILEENKDSYPVDGYVTKHVRYDENGEVKFPKYDKPNPADTVVVHYYALADYVKETYFQDSITKYGLFDFDLDIDYPLTTGQLNLIYNEFYKYVEPLKTIKFKSVRPQALQAGDSLSVDITNLATGQFIVNSIDCKVIANKGYKNKYSMPNKKDNLLIEQTIEMASYRDSLTDILAGFKPALYNKTAIVDNKIDYRNLMQLEIISQFNTGVATVSDIPSTPTGLTINSFTNTTASINWASVSGATSYKLYIYDAGVPISGYDGKVIAITSESVTGLTGNKAYTVKVSACNLSGCSALSSQVGFTTSQNDDFTNQSWDLWYGKTSMIGSGTSLANQAPTTINATITSPSWEASAKWTNGLNLNAGGRFITIPHNAVYKVSGANAQVCLATVVTVKALETSTFRTIYQTQGLPNTQINFYIAFNASQRLFLVMELVDSTQFLNPSILDMRSTPVLTVTPGQELGIAYRVDLQNSVIEFIINQTVYSYTITTGGIYYNSIADFKAAGGINSSTVNVLAVQSPITLQRYAIKKGVSGTLISSTDIRSEFFSMGLT